MLSTEKKFTSGNQWIIDSEYPNYKNLYKFLLPSNEQEYSSETSAHFAKQYPLWRDPNLSDEYYSHKKFNNDNSSIPWQQELDNITKWTQAKLIEHHIIKQITPVISWWMDYEPGGWQAMHTHSVNCITQVIYMDEPNINESTAAKDYTPGSMYALMTDGKPVYIPFVGFPGRSILMTGDVFHGVYPVKTTPRRSIIIDYIYNKND